LGAEKLAIEFPEAFTICEQMKTVLPGRTIHRVEIADPNSSVFRWGFSNLDKVDIQGERINQITQHGDQVHIHFVDRHLMFGDLIGKLLYHPVGSDLPPKAKILFHLDDGAAFSYSVSLYGYASAVSLDKAEAFIKETGLSPLDPQFTPDYLGKVFSESKRRIAKQQNVYGIQYKAAGVGNGYWHDILFLAGVLPARKSKDLTSHDLEQLHHHTVQVIRGATAAHGSADELDFFGNPGGYRRIMGRQIKDKPCPRCGNPITAKNLLGSTSYYCTSCQH
jgi:formamidopyrimidine-DNA glycosylase